MKKAKQLFFLYVKDFININRLDLKSEKTIDSYREGLDSFRKYLYEYKNIEIDKIMFTMINDILIREYLKWLIDNGKSISTRNARLTAIKQYIKYCSQRDIELVTLEISVSRIKCKTVKPKKHNWITKEQVLTIMGQTNRSKIGIRDRFIILFMFSTGARLAEMLEVKLKDITVDGEYPYIRLLGKGSKARIIPVTKEFVENYQYYLTLYHNESNKERYLFYTVIKGIKFKMSDDNVQRIVNKYTAKAQVTDPTIPKMHPHIFRHSYGALMYRSGLSLPEIAKLLGHEQLSTTEIYAETDIDMLNKALSKISDTTVDKRWDNLTDVEKIKVLGLKK